MHLVAYFSYFSAHFPIYCCNTFPNYFSKLKKNQLYYQQNNSYKVQFKGYVQEYLTLSQWDLCTAALLPEVKPAPCFLSAIIGQID